jgi:hypothetical protein
MIGSSAVLQTTSASRKIPDLDINSCPEGCGNCAGIYINEGTGHKIVCHCQVCSHTSCHKE